MNDQETPRRAATDHRDRSGVGEAPAPSGVDHGGTNRWLLLLDVGLSGLLGSILAAVVAMVAFFPFEWGRAFNQYQVNHDGTFKLQWVVAGGIAVGLAFMGFVYATAEPERLGGRMEAALRVLATLFFVAALVAGMIALKLFDAASG